MRPNAQQRDAIQVLHLHLTNVQLHDLWHDSQIGPSFPADIGEFLDQVIMLPAEGDDHRVDHLAADDRGQIAGAAQSLDAAHARRRLLRVVIQEADGLITKFGPR